MLGAMPTADSLIADLTLRPHPEGGWYRETWRAPAGTDGHPRGAGSSIVYLLEAGQRSHWHRIDASELWIFQAGAPLILSTALGETGAHGVVHTLLGPDPGSGQTLQHGVRPREWQAAWARDGWTLVACVVAPGFTFEGFEMAPPTWSPGD